jgi:hypothetical protein
MDRGLASVCGRKELSSLVSLVSACRDSHAVLMCLDGCVCELVTACVQLMGRTVRCAR